MPDTKDTTPDQNLITHFLNTPFKSQVEDLNQRWASQESTFTYLAANRRLKLTVERAVERLTLGDNFEYVREAMDAQETEPVMSYQDSAFDSDVALTFCAVHLNLL